MNKKILSLTLAAIASSTLITACGNSASTPKNETANSSTESSSNTEVTNPVQSSSIIDSPTTEVTKIASVDDFKGKDSKAVESILGKPSSENNNVYTYKKDGYTFDIT